jgi:hypothetical protein
MGTLTRQASRPLRAGLVLGLLAVLVAGCDLFKPATPEVVTSGCTLLASYALPESCLLYMQIGIEHKDDCGKGVYLGALTDGFRADFDLAVWNAYADTRPAEWDLSFEGEFVSRFIQAYPYPYRMEWLEDPDYPIANEDKGDQSRVLHRHYKVWARKPTADSLLIAAGYAKLTFTKVPAAGWALALWEDRVDPDAGFPPTDPDQQSFGQRRLEGR